MPIYEYQCKTCNERFEAIRPVGDRGKAVTCPECGRSGAVKLPSVFSASGNCGSGSGGFT